MKNVQGNRPLQRFILSISLMIVLVGIYLIYATGFTNFITMGIQTKEPPSIRHQPFLILFIVALVMTFFSGRNLLRRK